MKVNIYGKTESTITFNLIGLILRGNNGSSCSVAKNIELLSGQQEQEVQQLAKLGLITFEVLNEEVNEYIQEKEVEEVASTREAKTKSPRRKTKILDPDEAGSDVVVMTTTGPKSSSMTNKMSGEIEDNSDRTKASMEAAQEQEEQENEVSAKIDEGELSIEDRMGSKVVIGAGAGKAEKVSMFSSLTSKNDPEFIDLQLDKQDDVEPAFLDTNDNRNKDDVEAAFIDQSEEPIDDDADDAFVEM